MIFLDAFAVPATGLFAKIDVRAPVRSPSRLPRANHGLPLTIRHPDSRTRIEDFYPMAKFLPDLAWYPSTQQNSFHKVERKLGMFVTTIETGGALLIDLQKCSEILYLNCEF